MFLKFLFCFLMFFWNGRIEMFSRRVENLKAPPIYEIIELAKKYEDVVYLNIGEPGFDTPDVIKEAAIEAIKDGITKYTGSLGLLQLREKIADYETDYLKRDIGVENVIVTNGGTVALTASVLLFANPGDEVIVLDPWWPGHPRSVVIADAVPKPIEMKYNKGAYTLDLDAINEAITEKTKGIMIINPNNPTGVVFSRRELKGLAEIVEDNKLFIVADEVYDQILYDTEFVSYGEIASSLDNVLIVRSYSKNYAMTGWRVGYIVTSEKNIKALQKLNSAISLSQVSISQYAALSIYDNWDVVREEVKRMVEEYKKRRDIVVDALSKSKVFEFATPRGAFYIFPKFKLDMESIDFTKYLLDKARILVAPGYLYFGYSGKRNIRISFSGPTEKIRVGMDRLIKAFQN